MEIQDIVARIDRLEDQLSALNSSLSSLNSKLGEIDERTSNFLDVIREEKNEIAKLNSKIMNIGQYDASINQIRVDFNRKLDDIQKQTQQESQLRGKLIEDNINALKNQLEADKKEINIQFEKKLAASIEENSRVFNRLKELEIELRNRMQLIDELKNSINTISQDQRRSGKQIEGLQATSQSMGSMQSNLRAKIDTLSDSARTNESRINEIIATESERKQTQMDFIERQSLAENDRARVWKDWEKQFEDLSKELHILLPEVKNQQFSLKNAQADFNDVTQQFDRRINEITEIYRLMDERLRKEWETYKGDSEKRWANISMVLEDKQGGFSDQFNDMKERIVLMEDNSHEMQEALLLMSTEIQKGMQSIMKMVNGWMEAFGQIKTGK